jgi:hypothetical protein
MKTTAEFQTRVADFFVETQTAQARALRARSPSFKEVKFKAEKEVLGMRAEM